jgi:hypothetical protein
VNCDQLSIECVECAIDDPKSNAVDCIYGEQIVTNCTVKAGIKCSVSFISSFLSAVETQISLRSLNKGVRNFQKEGICRFCYQTPDWMHICTPNTLCKRDSWIRLHKVNCTVRDDVVCLGSRTFYKRVECNWTSGYKWSVTMVLSMTLGGFGIDRFYLGQYKVNKNPTK